MYIIVPSKGPTINGITILSPTSMKIIWETLSLHDASGVITQYKVCYKVSKNPADISCNFKLIVDGNNFILNGLLKATTYNVAVQAATTKGFGPLGFINKRFILARNAKPYECTTLKS